MDDLSRIVEVFKFRVDEYKRRHDAVYEQLKALRYNRGTDQCKTVDMAEQELRVICIGLFEAEIALDYVKEVKFKADRREDHDK